MRLVWRHGPTYHHDHPRRLKGLFAASLFLCTLLSASSLLAPEDKIVYQNRFLLLVTVSMLTFGFLSMMMLTVLENERGVASTPPWRFVIRTAMRTLRLMDSFSDIMYARVLWEKV